MLTVSTLGLLSYGVYSVGWAVVDVFSASSIEWWADLAQVGFGLLLIFSAAFVRVRLPGGVALAVGAMLGLQALAVHSAAHLGSGLVPQIGRAVLALFLVALAILAGPEHDGDAPST
jgi:hypothetical protein